MAISAPAWVSYLHYAVGVYSICFPEAWIIGVVFLIAGTVYYVIQEAEWQKRVLARDNNFKPSTKPDVGITDAH